jgi:hypothetical protein
MKILFSALALLLSPHVSNAFEIPSTCEIGVRVEFAKSTDGKLTALPVERASLVEGWAWLSASTTAKAPNDHIRGRQIDLERGSTILVPNCNSSTEISFTMRLATRDHLKYEVMYRPVFNFSGKEVALPWERLDESNQWMFDRLLSWFQQYYP